MVFQVGRIVVLPKANRALRRSRESAYSFVERHARGDWGIVDPEDIESNELSLSDGNRVFSWYKLKTGVEIWVITERGRSHTCVLRPPEYLGADMIPPELKATGGRR